MNQQKNNDLKKFQKKFTFFIVILFALDFLIGEIFKNYYFNQKSGILFNTTYAIDSTTADVLVFGSSRAVYHYNPAVFERKLHTTFYNCGRSQCGLIYYSAVLSAVLDRFTPKRVIIDINFDDFSRTEEGKLAPLLPYHDKPSIDYFLRYNSKFEYYKLLSRMYPYNSMLINAVEGHLPDNYVSDYKGYRKRTIIMPDYRKGLFVNAPVIKNRIKILENVLTRLNDKHVAVTLVVSPAYYKFKPDDPDVRAIEQLCKHFKNVKFYNYENNTEFDSNKLFSEEPHLNYIGADKFSEDLANKLIADK